MQDAAKLVAVPCVLIAAAVCAARSFAAKGALLDVHHADAAHAAEPWLRAATAESSLARGVANAMGVTEAMGAGLTSRGGDGKTDWVRGRRSIRGLLRELAHVQRVGGSREAELLLAIGAVGEHGAEYRSLAVRAVVRAGSWGLQELRASGAGRTGRGARLLSKVGTALLRLSRRRLALAAFSPLHSRRQSAESAGNPSSGADCESLSHMASALQGIGRLAEALEMFKRCDDLQIRAVGEDDPERLSTLNNMASCLSDMGRMQEALEVHERCREARARVLGKEHPDTIYSMSNIATVMG